MTYYSIGIGVKQNRKVCVRFEAPQLNSLISCINDQRCQYVCENNKDGNNLVTKKSPTSIETQIYGKVFFYIVWNFSNRVWRTGEWRSGESARRPPPCPGFDSRAWRWVNHGRFWAWCRVNHGLFTALFQGFSPCPPDFFAPQYQHSNSKFDLETVDKLDHVNIWTKAAMTNGPVCHTDLLDHNHHHHYHICHHLWIFVFWD